MNEEHGEVLSAWVDGEVAPAEVLRRALAQPGALETLDGLLALRAMLETQAEPSAAAIVSTRAAMGSTRRHRRHLAPQLRLALAAVVVLAIGTTVGLVLGKADRGPSSEVLRAPPADLVAQFPLE
jgi:negative regulator of sigma E activity